LEIAKKVNQKEIINFTIKKALSDIPKNNDRLKEVFENADYIIF
jgi:hypothetical protein